MIRVEHGVKNRELPFTCNSAYFQVYTIPKDCCASDYITTADVNYFGSVAFMLTTLSELRSLLDKAKNVKLATTTEEKS